MHKLYSLIITLVYFAFAFNGVQGGTMVTGTVFCDQCKDGQVSMFDYPISGMKVAMVCPGDDGQMTMVDEGTTNMFGSYGMSFQGTPDLTNCFIQISNNNNEPGSSNKCGASSGPPKSVRQMFSMFGMAMYTVDPLISQPAQPMSYCSSSSPPSTPTQPPPASSGTPVQPSTPPKPPAPVFRLPPMPGLPPMPPAPFLQEMACPYQYWMMPEYKCYWRAVSPDMTVALAFGPLAAEKYGRDMTLFEGLKGKGDPYRTLLREGVTSLLNSYNSINFAYNALEVVDRFNEALVGSKLSVLLTALRFKRANYGHGQIPCKLTSCH
ncbi:uncharacterized protein LOC141599519 [Silene latifolia]|uniref:uncharacterized protein LOC141599519 n=1 Tax=Silene latifolia TaxID=37657 RepID=UPI003D786CD1